MIDINKIYVWTIITGLLLLIPAIKFITFLDELTVVLFIGIALIDSLLNHCWKKYKLLWIVTAVIGLYAFYSIFFLSNNTTPYILMDWLIEVKPFVPFAVFLSAGIIFTPLEKRIIGNICLINGIITSFLLFAGLSLGNYVFLATTVHITYCGHIIFISALFYLYCKILPDGTIDRNTLWIVLAFLTIGLLCGRSKYFATFVCTLFFLLIYKPGFLRHFTAKHIIIICVLMCIIGIVTWQKFNYYFIVGNNTDGAFDPTVLQSFARPLLYITGYMIMLDYFPFGSGLASFASYPSSANYSDIYYQYGLNNIWGLSPTMPDFICDAYYPSLAQFGIVGLILFIWFWVHAYSYIRVMIRNYDPILKYPIIISILCTIFILVECTSGNTFTFSTGNFVMMLLGLAASHGYALKSAKSTGYINEKELKPTEYKI